MGLDSEDASVDASVDGSVDASVDGSKHDSNRKVLLARWVVQPE
jgi:hypothetical protein